MSAFGARTTVIALTVSIALALPAIAQRGAHGGGPPAISRGGGGAVFHGGGGGFYHGGGGAVFRGGAPRVFAPSFARPAFRGGAPRISGPSFARPAFHGGAPRISGPHFARPAFGARPEYTGPSFPERRLITGATPRFGTYRVVPGSMRVTRTGVTRVTGFRTMGIRTIRPFVPPTAHRLARAGVRTPMAAYAFQRADWRRYRHRYGWYAWAGPVFWPYAYYDLFDHTFWYYGPYAYYDDLFWDYGYGDIIYGGLFAPYGYDTYAYWTPSRARRADARAAPAAPAPGWSEMCGEDSREIAGLPIERIQDAVQPDDAQRRALDELANATVKAAGVVKEACPAVVAITPPGRLQAMEQRLQAMAQAVDIIRPPLETFYKALSDEQKERFNAVLREQGKERRGRRQFSLTQTCGRTPELTEWPQEQIEEAVRPTEAQRVTLAGLKDAATKAADILKSACPSELPLTPPTRLAAVSDRVNAMLQAVRTVHTALDKFYGSLSDEQKAQFNVIGQGRASR